MQNCLVVVVAVFVVAVPFSSTPDKNLFLEAENFCLEHLDMSMSFKTFKRKNTKDPPFIQTKEYPKIHYYTSMHILETETARRGC